jgi:two-component system cell cycle response regulator
MLQSQEKILIVDDSAAIRSKLRELLIKNHYRIEEAKNGVEALQKAGVFCPDLILLDIVMPKIDGLKALQTLRKNQHTQDTPIIMVTSNASGKDITTGLDLGANGYITKPFDDDVLLAHIQSHLNTKRRFNQILYEKEDLYVANQLITTLHAKKKARDILLCLVQKISEYIQVKRCSVIRINPEGAIGVVEASSEGAEVKGLRIDLNKYPEIMEALKSKDVVIIPDAVNNELMSPVKDVLQEIGCSSLVVVPIVHGDDLIGTLLLNTARSKDSFSEREVRFLKGISKSAKTALLNAQIFETLDQKGQPTVGSLDPLTKLYSYYKFLEMAEGEIYRAKRYKHHLALIMIDINQLRKVNKAHGQGQGDHALQEIGRLITDSIRKSDLAARCQGDDFALLLPETSHIGATIKAKQFQKMVLKNPTLHKLGVTVLVGVSSIEETVVESPIDLIHAAEIELERAKTKPFAL